MAWQAAFAIGVLRDIYAFHRYTTHSAYLKHTQVSQFQWQFYGWATNFHRWLKRPPTHPLNPINPDNARILRITAAAGTELADAFSSDTCNTLHVAYFTLRQKRFTTRRAVFPHATWLVQSADHWPIFLTAASRRSLDRVSVPMWGTFLSEPLSIEGLVGRYPANNLMERIPIDDRNSLIVLPCGRTMPSGINLSFERLSPSHRQVGYVLLTRAPVAIKLSKLSSCCPSTCMC